MNRDLSDFEIYIGQKCTDITKSIIKESKVLCMPTAKVIAIVGNKYSVQIVGDTNIITGLNNYSSLPIIVGDEVLLMIVGNSLTNVFIFSKKII